jgi:hypothetical protein
VEVWSDGQRLGLGSRKQRFVLAVLALEVNPAGIGGAAGRPDLGQRPAAGGPHDHPYTRVYHFARPWLAPAPTDIGYGWSPRVRGTTLTRIRPSSTSIGFATADRARESQDDKVIVALHDEALSLSAAGIVVCRARQCPRAALRGA